jgi:hypothetical protein
VEVPLTRLDYLLQQAAQYALVDLAVPLDLEAAIAAEGGSLSKLTDNTEE